MAWVEMSILGNVVKERKMEVIELQVYILAHTYPVHGQAGIRVIPGREMGWWRATLSHRRL